MEHENDDNDNEFPVLTLTEATFGNAIKSNKYLLIAFYLPWCAYCKRLEPIFENAAMELKKEAIAAKFARVDGSTNQSLCEQLKIEGYPTLIWFKNGQSRNYEGLRDSLSLIGYVKLRCRASIKVLLNADAIARFIHENSFAAVAFVHKDTEDDFRAFEEIADSLGAATGLSFAFAIAPNIRTLTSTIHLYVERDLIHSPIPFTEATPSFISSIPGLFPLIGAITADNYDSYIRRGLPLVWAFLETNNRENNITLLKEVASTTKGILSWVWVDAVAFTQNAEDMGLSPPWPGVVLHDILHNQKYIFAGTWDSVSFLAWSLQVLNKID
ncbi:thioredoxin-like protein [Obelidium mucronatum]|nr:thioredoxin-like protein [Obelidium mucronatum]